jgi:hypothetical protein
MRHGGGTKITQIAKIAMKTPVAFFVIFVAFAAFVPARSPWRVSVFVTIES